jgi:hypothetical protein
MTPSQSPLPGPNILLQGDAGTGKTRSIATLVEAGIEVFYLSIEQGIESLFGYWTDQGKPIPANLHWHKIDPPKVTFKALAEAAEKVNTFSYESLGKVADPNRHLHNLFIKVNEAFFDFPCDRTGKKFGPVDSWGPDRAIVVDGLTGLSRAVMSLTVGSKPIKNPGDYGIAQGQLEGYLRLICDHCRCWFILLAHVEKEIDPVLGGMKITVSTVGQKLAPLIPPMFSDVIYCVRDGVKWTWNTAGTGVVTKARNLPWAEGILPDFRPLVEVWKKRAAAAAESLPPAALATEQHR